MNGHNYRRYLKYERALGQILNKNMTSIFFSSNTRPEDKSQILNAAGALVCGNYEKYFGLPTILDKSRYNSVRCMKERVWQKKA